MSDAGSKRVFVDTNVLIYAVDPLERGKHERAAEWISVLWKPDTGRTSWQVLNEFYFNAIRKTRVPAANARSMVESLSIWNPIGTGFGIVQRAWHWMDNASLSYWDALIVASAETTGSDFLLSEDFETGRKFGRVKAISPFERNPAELGYSPVSRA